MRVLVVIFITLFFTVDSFGQGCSDAGFCTMGAMRPNQAYSKKLRLKLRSIEYNFYRGTSLLSPIIYAHTIEFNASLGNKMNIQAKIPYMHIEGKLGKNDGIGDISLSVTRELKQINGWNLGVTFGAKIPTNNGNSNVSNEQSAGVSVPLHMYYQTSLGSIDGIAGFSMVNSKWMFATGVQVAFTQNENYFQWGDWSQFEDQEYLTKYNVGRNLARGTDIMFRVERSFRFTNFDFSVGLLPIYRITRDEVFKPENQRREKLDETIGLALSGLTSIGYNFSVKNGVRLIYGLKLVDRNKNPDGLTRKDVWSMSYIYRF
jgi:hypothetical protein